MAKRLREVTTFQGDYRYSNKPIIVGPESESWRQERVLAELRTLHLAATMPERMQQWHRVEDVHFNAVHYRFAAGNSRYRHNDRATASIGPFTPHGPNFNKPRRFRPM